MNEENKEAMLVPELAVIDAPPMVPSEEVFGEAVLVQTEAETGEKDEAVVA